MGLGNSNHSIFLKISEGKVCRQVAAPTKISKERTNKVGKLVHEEFYDHVSGRITEIGVREHADYGKFWEVKIEDKDGTVFNLQFNYSSGYANGFLKALPNCDLGKEVTLIPNMKMEGDKKKTTLFISQDGKALRHFYTKDNPNGLPQLQQIKRKGKLEWDDSDMMEFLENMVNTQIKPKLAAAQPAGPVAAGGDDQDEHVEEVDVEVLPDGSKLPF